VTHEPLSKVDRGTLNDRVYYEIRRALMSGGFAPGTTITLQAFAEKVGTSIMPVRDALRRLVAERALDLLPNRVVAVPVLTPERLHEIRDMRLALESMAAALSAARIADRDLAQLASTYELMHGQRERLTANQLALNQDFHFTIYRAAGRPTLLAMIETLWMQFAPMLSEVVRQGGPGLAPQHHAAALAALRERNGRAAGRAVAAAILAASELIMTGLDPSSRASSQAQTDEGAARTTDV
jgi:DNA-binding GntR family transcriptional regulator